MLLSNPDFGNTYEIQPNVAVRLSVDGDVRRATFNGPTVQRQAITLSGLSESQKDALKAFLLGNAGVQFQWHTHLGTVINVIAVGDSVSFVSRGSGCMYEVSLNLEVVP